MIDKAKTIATIEALANGIDPITGELLPAGHLLQHPDIVRALFHTVDLIKSSRNASTALKNGSRWSDREDEALKEAFAGGASFSQLAKTHLRTSGAIRARLQKLGIISE
jgi:hypothetical protein